MVCARLVEQQKLNDIDFLVDINSEKSTGFLSYLQKQFKRKNLTSDEEFFFEFFALLPQEGISIEDITLMCGVDFYKKNKAEFTNISNSLHKKGWVKKKGDKIKLHRIVREITIYSSRENRNPFFGFGLYIQWLFRRIDEVSQTKPEISFRYLRYAESILTAIKEPYRTSIYQPLLLLENALLNAYRWIYNSHELHLRWIDLISRASKYLHEEDPNLAIMYNNLGVSYNRRGEYSEGLSCFKKSILSLKNKEVESLEPLIISRTNLASTYIGLKNIDKAQKEMSAILSLISKYSLGSNQSIPVLYN